MISARGKVRLSDALQALDTIQGYLAGRSYDDYLEIQMLRNPVERQMEIAGEALTVFRRLEPEVARSIDDLAQAIGFRNILAHEYGSVDDQIVWQVATFHAPRLRQAVAAMLASSG